MLLVILGAGASYDSAPSQPPNDGNYSNLADRPPLANELFGNRKYFGEVMNKYHRCIPIITRLRQIVIGAQWNLNFRRCRRQRLRILSVTDSLQQFDTICRTSCGTVQKTG